MTEVKQFNPNNEPGLFTLVQVVVGDDQVSQYKLLSMNADNLYPRADAEFTIQACGEHFIENTERVLKGYPPLAKGYYQIVMRSDVQYVPNLWIVKECMVQRTSVNPSVGMAFDTMVGIDLANDVDSTAYQISLTQFARDEVEGEVVDSNYYANGCFCAVWVEGKNDGNVEPMGATHNLDTLQRYIGQSMAMLREDIDRLVDIPNGASCTLEFHIALVQTGLNSVTYKILKPMKLEVKNDGK